MLKFLRKYWFIIILLLFFPLILEGAIVKNNIPSRFTNSEWFSFWGSYIGSIITCIVLYITIQLNNKQILAGLKADEIRTGSQEKLELADYAYKIVSLMDYYPCENQMTKFNLYNFLLYDFKLLRFKMTEHDNHDYFDLVDKLINNYTEKIEVIKNPRTMSENYIVLESLYADFESGRELFEKYYNEYKALVADKTKKEIMGKYNLKV